MLKAKATDVAKGYKLPSNLKPNSIICLKGQYVGAVKYQKTLPKAVIYGLRKNFAPFSGCTLDILAFILWRHCLAVRG